VLAVNDLVVSYVGSERPALDGVSLRVEPRQTLAVVGRSGSGKSTLLRVIAGLVTPDQGDVLLDGESIRDRPPQARRVALVFQDDALFTNMTVRKNLHFVLRERRDAALRIEELAVALHFEPYLDRWPRELSGGERQRVALARALLSDPQVLLLDEPLAHLDPELRVLIRDEVVGLRSRFTGPIVYVTHDHTEAMSVGDDLAVLMDGVIEDQGSPQRVYDSPRTARAARFLGERSMNLIDGTLLSPPDEALLGIRPEHVRITSNGRVRGQVIRCEPTGADVYVHVSTSAGEILVRVASKDVSAFETEVGLEFPYPHVQRFDRVTGVALA